MKKYISAVIAVGTLLFIISIVAGRFDIVKESFLQHKAYFFLIALTYAGGRLLDGLKLKVLVAKHGLKVKKIECFGLSFIMPLYNLMFPNAGQVTNALYLKSKYDFKFRNFVSVGLVRTIITVTSSGIIGISAGILYMFQHKTFIMIYPIILYFVLICAALALFFILPEIKGMKKYRFLESMSGAFEGLKEVRKDPKLIGALSVFQTGIISLFILRYYIVFKALSFSASLAGIAAVIPMTAISNLINIIPANLAIREAVVSASSMLIGFTPEQGILVAAIDRSVILITLFFTGGWFFIRLRYFDNLILKKNIEGVGAGSDDV